MSETDENRPDSTGLPAGYHFRPDWEVTPLDLAAWLRSDPESICLVDCRTPEEHALARIEGSVLIPLPDLVSDLENLDIEPGTKVIVHCHHGQRSLRATLALRQMGIEDCWSLAGGIDAWSCSVDPQVPRY